MKQIPNIQTEFRIVHDGYSFADEIFSTIEAAKERQIELSNSKYANPTTIYKQTIITQPVENGRMEPNSKSLVK